MPTYLAFLRAVNVGKRMFAKAAIVQACEDAGFTDVETYINTGNVRVTTSLRSRAKVESALEKAFAAAAGFDVPTIVFTPKELQRRSRPTPTSSRRRAQRAALRLPAQGRTDRGGGEEAGRGGQGRASVRRCAAGLCHLLLGKDYHSAKLSNAVVEKHLGVATNRNVKVIRTLAEKWGAA